VVDDFYGRGIDGDSPARAGPGRRCHCYNCPPQWADFASMLKAIKADLGYDIPFDNKNSGQASAMS
jgi:putative spermidine/putrescine transport system substrate-binding protein